MEVDAKTREELLELTSDNALMLYRLLKPDFSQTTFMKGIKGYPVSDETVSWFRSQHAMHTMRLFNDAEWEVAMSVAKDYLERHRGRKVNREDFERELRLRYQTKPLPPD